MPEVLILGGGLAGSIVARLLRRELPHVQVTLVEANEQALPKVGESLVERASKFLIHRLGLGALLYREHLPKSGLRFFFGEGPLHQRSEIGLDSFGFHPSFQLDRPALEERLLALNAADGVQVLRGWKVVEVQVEPNRVVIEREGERRELRGDWVVDASGRRRLLSRQLGLVRPVPGHPVGARWAWLRGVADMDALGDEGWRARFRHTARGLATCHLLEEGAWSWLIPLRGGLTSVGRVSLDARPLALQPPELFAGAEVVRTGQLDRITVGSARIFGPGWALVGDAAFATDPLYSPGLDYLADQAEQLVELVRLQGDPEALLAFERWQQQRFTTGVLLVQDQYPALGDFDLFRVRQVLDVGSYYNLLSAWTERDFLDPRWIRRFLRFAEVGNADLARLGQRFAAMPRQGRNNQGCSDLALMRPELQAAFGEPRRLGERLRTQQRLIAAVDATLDNMGSVGPEPFIRGFFDRLQ